MLLIFILVVFFIVFAVLVKRGIINIHEVTPMIERTITEWDCNCCIDIHNFHKYHDANSMLWLEQDVMTVKKSMLLLLAIKLLLAMTILLSYLITKKQNKEYKQKYLIL
ncbi:hypothetical protein [Candidatus Ichthyocystis sparus]|uniref:hypothetical protein n=1 Tax=Candidatus Ichthyocystis sparus TaxID=1561004 RepID=UPI000B89E188|nr:hypothetical protein [Candidatus Ichthyocystis sparus]